MQWFEALLLGLLQGLTEFLPVSSSGHLVIAKSLFGIDTQNATFEIVVHAATVLSTLVVFRKLICDVVRGVQSRSLLWKILFSLIPVLIVGLFFKDQVEALFGNGTVVVGIMLLVTALLLGVSDYLSHKRDISRPIGYRDAFIIGIAQAIAVLPGLSRSGATISTGLMLGNNKSDLASFSFLMVLIPVLGEAFLKLLDGAFAPAASGISSTALVIGFLAAFISGLLSCRLMIRLVKKARLGGFAIYCLVVGILCFFL